MTLKCDAIFEEKLTCGLENDMRNLENFHKSTWKCQYWDTDGILASKVENVRASYLQRSYVSLLWRMIQNLTRIDLPFQNWNEELHEFWPKHSKVSKICTWFLLPKVYNFSAKKVQRFDVWWYCRLMQNLKYNWLVLSKLTWGIWQIFTGWKIAISF